MLAARNRVHQLAVLIENLDLQISENVASLLIVGNLRFRRPAPAVEALIPFRPPPEGLEILNRLARNEALDPASLGAAPLVVA